MTKRRFPKVKPEDMNPAIRTAKVLTGEIEGPKRTTLLRVASRPDRRKKVIFDGEASGVREGIVRCAPTPAYINCTTRST